MTVPYSPEIDELPDTAVGQLVSAEAVAQDQIADRLVASLLALWATFSAFWDGEESAQFGQRSAQIVRSAQRRSAGITEVHLRRQFRQMELDVPNVQIDLPEDLRLGADTDDVYQRPIRKLRYLIYEGMAEEEAAEVARERLEAQALTDLQLARATASQQFYYATSPEVVTGWRRIIHPELGQVCGLCIAASDRIYQRINRMDLHPACVTGDTPVSADGVAVATRRWYAGPFVVLRTASGKKLRITPNHPVLTDQGWVSAGRLQKGDRVVRHSGGNRAVSGVPDEQHQPTSAEDLWRALTVKSDLLPRSVPLSPEDLHGDGGDGEVDVVFVDRHLAPIGSTTFSQPCREQSFGSAHGGWAGFTGSRSLDLLGTGLDAPASRLVSSPSQLQALLAGRSAHAQVGGIATTSRLYASLQQSSANYWSGQAKSFGDAQLRLSSLVTENDLFNGYRGVSSPTRFDPPGDESTLEGRRAYAMLGSQLRERLSGEVELDEIVDLDRVDGSDHVYNFQTAEGWYDADSLVVSNCKCTTLPIVKVGGETMDPGRSLNAADLSAVYAAAGNTTDSRALSKTRIQVRENGELGPILMADGVEYKGPEKVKSQLSAGAAERRLQSIQGQLDRLRSIENPNAWYRDRIEQLEELAAAA